MISIPPDQLYLFRETARDLIAYFAEIQAAFEQFDLKMIPFLQKRLREIHLPKLRGVEVRLELHVGEDPHVKEWLKFTKNLSGGCQILSGPINPANPASLLTGFQSAGDTMVALFPYRHCVPELEKFYLEIPPPDGFKEPVPHAAIERVEFISKGAVAGHALLFKPCGRGIADKRPLAVALHGAFGGAAEFLSLWLRTLHSHCWYGLVPKSRGMSWEAKDDFPAIIETVRRLIGEEHVDPAKVLVTGLSDGGSASLELALSQPDLFKGASCVSGVLKPWLPVETTARKLPIHIMHGTADFLFPVQTARLAEARLKNAGFPVTYKEIQGLSHTYPISRNKEIVEWFEKA